MTVRMVGHSSSSRSGRLAGASGNSRAAAQGRMTRWESYQHLGHCVTGVLHLGEFAVEQSSMRGMVGVMLDGGAFVTRQSRSTEEVAGEIVCERLCSKVRVGDQYFQQSQSVMDRFVTDNLKLMNLSTTHEGG